MTQTTNLHRQITAATLGGLLLAHFAIRWLLAGDPFLAPPDYDESITGLMALHFLRGQGEIFFWGQPYMGTLEPLFTAAAFWLGGASTLAMRLTLVGVSSLTLLAVYAIGRELGGRQTGLLAGLFWALPPVFITFDGLYATGGHLESVAAGALFIYGVCRLAFRPPPREALFALAISVAAGLGFWCSLLVAPVLAACVAALLVARPRLLLTRVPWVMLAGFLLGSAPFWWWNLGHDFMTFRAVEKGAGHILGNLWLLLQGVWLPTVTGAWWDGNSVAGLIPWPARAAVVALVYLPVLGLLLVTPALWATRLLRRQPPLTGPLDVLVAAAWGAMLAHAASSYGHTGVTRYAETLFLPLAGLCAWWLARAWRWRKAAGLGLAVLLFGFNLASNLLFARSAPLHPQRSAPAVVAKLQELGVTHALANGRVAYPISFLSGEKVTCADFFGWRNYAYLEAVKSAPKVALVAHEEMGNPSPAALAWALAMIGTHGRRVHVHPHTFWCDFEPPAPTRPLPAARWRIFSSQGERGLERTLADRDLASAWTTPSQAGSWLELEMGEEAQVAGLTLLAAPAGGLAPLDPVALAVQTSSDGLTWTTAAEGLCLTGLSWVDGHPLVREAPLLEVRFPARAARKVRVVFNPGQDKARAWPLAEVYLHAPDPEGRFAQPQPASQALREADRLLAPYFDEPLGPHPRFPGVPAAFRCARVDWAGVLAAGRRAVAAGPEWPEPQIRLLEMILRGRLAQRQTWPDPSPLVLEKGEALGLAPGVERPGRLLEISGQGGLRLGEGLDARTLRVEPERPWLGPLVKTPLGDQASGLVAARGQEGQMLLRLLSRPAPPEGWPAGTSRLSFRQAASQMSADGLAPSPSPASPSGLALALGPAEAGREVKVWFPFFLERGRYQVEFRVRGERQEQPLATFGLVRHFLHRPHDQPVQQAWAGEDQGDPAQVALVWDNDLEPVKLEAKVTYHGPGRLEIQEIVLRPVQAWSEATPQTREGQGR